MNLKKVLFSSLIIGIALSFSAMAQSNNQVVAAKSIKELRKELVNSSRL